jgi:hypothetical protein
MRERRHTVGCRAVVRQRPRKGSLLCNISVNTFPQQQTRTQQWYSNRGTVLSVVRTAAVATQRRSKQMSTTINLDKIIKEMCFLCGSCRDVISKGQSSVLYERL